jgi:hypothetical protein
MVSARIERMDMPWLQGIKKPKLFSDLVFLCLPVLQHFENE